MIKTKIIEVPELQLKLTIEWKQPETQFEFAFDHKSLFDIEQEVWTRVTGLDDVISLSKRNNHQLFANARHIFCFVAKTRHLYTVDAIATYLQRHPDSVKHSIKRVAGCHATKDGPLWAAYKRWEQ